MPEAVRRAAEAADAQIAEMTAPQDGQPPAQPENQPAAQPPLPVPGRAPQPEAQPDADQRYRSLEGRFAKTRKDLEAAQDEVANLRQHVRNLEAQAARGPLPPEIRFDPKDDITAEERAEYGDEFLSLVERQTKKVTAPLLAEIERLKAGTNAVAENMALSVEERFYNALDAAQPGWDVVGGSIEFKTWCLDIDEVSGHRRQELLDQAIERRDVTRSLGILRAFLRETGATGTPGSGQPPANSTPAPAASSKPTLSDFAAPGTASTGSAPLHGADVKLISERDISTFYADVAKGKYKGREQERMENEAEIAEAMRLGRVVP